MWLPEERRKEGRESHRRDEANNFVLTPKPDKFTVSVQQHGDDFLSYVILIAKTVPVPWLSLKPLGMWISCVPVGVYFRVHM